METPGLLMRQWRQEDFESYAEFFVEAELAKYVGGQQDRPRAWRTMASVAGHWLPLGYGFWAVEEKSSAEFVGCVGLWFPEGWPELELGYWLKRDIQNGGFENDFASWVPVDNVSISTQVVRSGSKSLMASDTTATQFSYAYQQLSLDYGTNEITFWVNPASSSYFSALELIANWQSGTAIFITRVLLRDNALSLTAVDTSTTIPNILAQNTWNEITIFVRKSSLTQDFFINDSLVSSLTSSSLTDSTTTANADKRETVPGVFVLRQNFPNPFNRQPRFLIRSPGRPRLN